MYLIIAAVVAVILIALYVRRVRKMSILARNGIPGPKPHLIYGNLLEFARTGKVTLEQEWVKKYGKIVGFYLGERPAVLVADADLAKNIQIKDFHLFPDRPRPTVKNGPHPEPGAITSLIKTQGKRWKEMRSALTPTFSGSKLKTMTPIIDDSINKFINIVDKQSKTANEFDIYDMFQNLTTDVIGRTAFGIQSNVQNETNNKFLTAAKAIFNIKINRFFFVVIQCFNFLDIILYPIRRLEEIVLQKLGKSPNGILFQMARDIVKLRKQNTNIKRKDLLQLMLDTKISGEVMSAMTDEILTAGNDSEVTINGVNGYHNGIKSSKKDISLTDDEITANCVLFYEAGYETTSTALGYMAHILVNYPEVQEKVRQEVRDLYESEGKLDYNTVTKLQYMEWVLNETLRIYPPVIGFVTRQALTDYQYKDMTIPKGTTIMMATNYLHHDPQYWSEPEKFDPERFSPDRKHQIYPSSWQPFGSGPRNCIGLRFALFEAKLCLAKLLLNYRLDAGPKTEIGKLTTDCKAITMCPKKGVFVKAVKL